MGNKPAISKPGLQKVGTAGIGGAGKQRLKKTLNFDAPE